jgi:hypothetical protein
LSCGADREADCAADPVVDREEVSADAVGERVVGGMTATNSYAVAATSLHFVLSSIIIFLSINPVKKLLKNPRLRLLINIYIYFNYYSPGFLLLQTLV